MVMNLLYYNYIRYERSPRAGAVVQLGERFPCTEEVAGSTPVSSTLSSNHAFMAKKKGI